MSDHPSAEFGMRSEELEGLVAGALEQAREQGADQAEAGAALGTGLAVTVRRGDVETLEYQRDRAFTITVYFDQRKGSASTSDLSPSAIAEGVKKACSIARYTAQDACAGLADAQLMATDIPELELDHPWSLTPDEAIQLATRCESAGRDFDERISNSEGGSINTARRARVYGNSHGFVGSYASSSHSLSCVLVAGAGDGMERDFWYSSSRDPAALMSPEAVGKMAAERTLRRLGGRKIETCSAPVIFPAELARGCELCLRNHRHGPVSTCLLLAGCRRRQRVSERFPHRRKTPSTRGTRKRSLR